MLGGIIRGVSRSPGFPGKVGVPRSNACIRLQTTISNNRYYEGRDPGMFSRSIEKYEAQAALSQKSTERGRPSLPPSTLAQDSLFSKRNPSSLANPLHSSKPTTINRSVVVPATSQNADIARPTSASQGVGLGRLHHKTESLQENNATSKTMNTSYAPTKPNLFEAVYFDENDFDDDLDLDLDIEDPVSKGTIAPPLPTSGRSTNDAYISDKSANAHVPPSSSSIPLPWSSSPLEHKKPMSNGKRSFTSEAHKESAFAEPMRAPPADLSPRPKKRRTLPWPEQSSADSGSNQTYAHVTPISSRSGNRYPWDKTASALKAEQKSFRNDNKKLVKSNSVEEQSGAKPIRSALTTDVPPIFLSEEQKRVMSLIINQGGSVFFTGSAGTGKSVLLREIIKEARNKFQREPDRVAVTASTGLAACNIGGVTLHSFSGIGLGKETVSQLVKKIRRNPKAKNRWLRTKMLIIDEISMVDGELFDKLEAIGRTLRNDAKPFGGIQLVLTGDFFQLPPVPDSGKVARFAFDANTWSSSIAHTIGLTQVFRQSDPAFAQMLNEMRVGTMNQHSIDTFRSLSRPIQYSDGLEATELFSTRAEVENANSARLRNLPGESMTFCAKDGGKIEDKAQRDKLLSNCMAPVNINLKKDAQVMLIKNTDGSLVNGSLGKVVGFMSEKQFDNYVLGHDGSEDHEILENPALENGGASMWSSKVGKGLAPDLLADTGHKWPVVRFALPGGTSRDILVHSEQWKIELPNGEVQASRTQIPIILAWALSIHKAQGQTLARVKVDLGRVFEKGQAYVALSRATCQEGLQVLRFDPRKVSAHEKVRGFYNSLYSASEASKTAQAKPKPSGDIIDLEALEDFERSHPSGWDSD